MSGAEELRAVLAAEFARHGSTMSYGEDDLVRLGCLCGHERGVVTKAELAADLSGFVQQWRAHVADALLPLVVAYGRECAAAALEEAAADRDMPQLLVRAWLRARAAALKGSEEGT